MITNEMVIAPSGFDESHAKVALFISMFEQMKVKFGGKPKTA